MAKNPIDDCENSIPSDVWDILDFTHSFVKSLSQTHDNSSCIIEAVDSLFHEIGYRIWKYLRRYEMDWVVASS